MTWCCPDWLEGMRLPEAREAAKNAGFAVTEKETRPPRGVEGDPPARVLRVRLLGPAAVELVAGYEQHVLRGPEKPPRRGGFERKGARECARGHHYGW